VAFSSHQYFYYLSHFSDAHAMSISYTPFQKIEMTGSVLDARFDVQKVITNELSMNEVPYLQVSDMTLRGSFYLNDIWWVEFHTGSYNVWLDCKWQDITNLTQNCYFTGTGYAENIGEINFSNIIFSPSTLTLAGNIHTNLGDINLDGIMLPLWRVFIANDFSIPTVANPQIPITIINKEKYGDNNWQIDYLPILSAYTKSSTNSFVWLFSRDKLRHDDYWSFMK